MPMMAYTITNSANGKRYIGITTTTLRQRWMEHARLQDETRLLPGRSGNMGGIPSELSTLLLPGTGRALWTWSVFLLRGRHTSATRIQPDDWR